VSDRLAAAVAELVAALREELLAELARQPAPAPVRPLSIPEAAAMLGVSRSTLYAEIQAGRCRSVKVGGRRLVPTSALAEYVDRALRTLEADAALLARWRARCASLLVDEVQDVDRSQLRLALLLAAPGNRIFLVGDDDQSLEGLQSSWGSSVLRGMGDAT